VRIAFVITAMIILITKAIRTSETPVCLYEAMQGHIPEGSLLNTHLHRRENLKSYKNNEIRMFLFLQA
jgi:hypothetical protein